MENPPFSRSKLKRETREELVRLFPATFMPKGAEKKPLKLRIDADIAKAAPHLSRAAIKLALFDYTSGMTYLRNMVEGAPRLGIDGLPDGLVSEVHATIAQNRFRKLERRQAAARRQAIAAARRVELSSAAE